LVAPKEFSRHNYVLVHAFVKPGKAGVFAIPTIKKVKEPWLFTELIS